MIKHVSPVLFLSNRYIYVIMYEPNSFEVGSFVRAIIYIVLGKNIPFLFIENIYVSQKNKFPRKRLNNASLLFGQWSSIRGYRS